MSKIISLKVLVAVLSTLAIAAVGATPAAADDPVAPSTPAQIVYTDGFRIASMTADGSGKKLITHGGFHKGQKKLFGDSEPVVSPDGSRIAFIRSVVTGKKIFQPSLMIGNRDGSGVRTLVPGSVISDGEDIGRIDSSGSPTWAIDGSQIFFRNRLDRFLTSAVSSINSILPDGGDLRTLYHHKAVVGKNFKGVLGYVTGINDVDMSPDGKTLLVSESDIGNLFAKQSKVSLFDLETRKLKLIQKAAYGAHWSPDGSKIVFASQRARIRKPSTCGKRLCLYYSKLYTMNSDGTGVKRLTKGRGKSEESASDWSPDGSTILFSSYSLPKKGYVPHSVQIFSIGADGSCRTQLTKDRNFNFQATWVPNSGNVYSAGSCLK